MISESRDQRGRIQAMGDRMATSLGIEFDDFDLPPFSQQGVLGRVYRLFRAELPKVLEDLNRELVA